MHININNVMNHFTSKQWAMMALALWCLSLLFNGFGVHGDQDNYPGYAILLMGWLSPLVYNFAWYANPLFLIGIYRIKNGKSAILLAIFACLLALDVLRFSSVMTNAAGYTLGVYGIGWGGIVWLLAIFLFLSAAAKQFNEQHKKEHNDPSSTTYLGIGAAGILLCTITIVLTLFFAAYDRLVANEAEKHELAGVAFKKGAVCTKAFTVEKPIAHLSGPVEIVFEGNTNKTKFPFKQIEDLLNWGIPVVRIFGKDFRIEKDYITALPAQGEPQVRLIVREEPSSRGNTYAPDNIHIKLIDQIQDRIVFDHTWEKESTFGSKAQGYCPHYDAFPGKDDQPRQLITQALNIKAPPPHHVNLIQRHVEASLTPATLVQQPLAKDTPIKGSSDSVSIGTMYWVYQTDEVSNALGPHFSVNKKAYYFGKNYSGRAGAFFTDTHVYLYHEQGASRGDYLHVEKRALADFRWQWHVDIELPEPLLEKQALFIDATRLHLQAVEERDGKIRFSVFNKETSESAVLEILAPKKPSSQSND